MPEPLQLITVRLHPTTIKIVAELARHPSLIHPNPTGHLANCTRTRADVLRHAITAGLDLLIGQEPLELTEPEPCRNGKTIHPKTTEEAATAS